MVGAIAASVVFLFVLTAETFNVFDTPIVPANTPDQFYDAQATALLHGHLDVPRQAIGFEGFLVDGKYYGYFGPTPSIFRAPILLVVPDAAGHLTNWFMLAAFAATMYYSSRLIWDARRLLRQDLTVSRSEACAVGLFVFLLGAGTTTVFLAEYVQPYHEAILWGVACVIATFSVGLRFVLAPSRLAPLWLGVFATLALLARSTMGLTALTAVALIMVTALVARLARGGWAAERIGQERARRFRDRMSSLMGIPELDRFAPSLGPLAVAVAIPLIIFAMVNYAKFGSLLSIPYDQHVLISSDPWRLARFREWGLFSPAFLPGNVFAYLRPDGLTIRPMFPWVDFKSAAFIFPQEPPSGIVFSPFHAALDGGDNQASVTATMPALVLLSAIGLVVIARSVPHQMVNAARIFALSSAVGLIAMCSFAGFAQRYDAEFLPILTLCSAVGLYVLLRWRVRHPLRKVLLVVVVLLAGAFGVFVNLGLAIPYLHTEPGVPTSPSTRTGLP